MTAYDRYYLDALEMYENGNFSGAVDGFQKALRIRESAEAHYHLAYCYLDLKKHQKALFHAKLSFQLENSSDSENALMIIIDIYIDQKDYELAFLYCDQWVKLSPNNRLAFSVRASCHNNLKRLEEAENDYLQALELPEGIGTEGSDAQLHALIAQTRLKRKDAVGAYKAARASLKIDSKNSLALQIQAATKEEGQDAAMKEYVAQKLEESYAAFNNANSASKDIPDNLAKALKQLSDIHTLETKVDIPYLQFVLGDGRPRKKVAQTIEEYRRTGWQVKHIKEQKDYAKQFTRITFSRKEDYGTKLAETVEDLYKKYKRNAIMSRDLARAHLNMLKLLCDTYGKRNIPEPIQQAIHDIEQWLKKK